MRTFTGFLVFSLIILGLSAGGCKKNSEATPASTSVYTPGDVNDSVGMTVKILLEDEFDYYFHEQSSFVKECKISASDAAAGINNDIYCILDAPELDLYYNKIALNFNVPRSMCKYTRLKFFAYYNRLWGNINANDADDGVATLTSTTDANGTTTYAADADHPELSIGEEGVKCTWDYGETGNCCEGTYNLNEITYIDDDGDVGTPAVPVSNLTTGISYGGNRANCLSGPAMDLQDKGNDGFPMPLLYRTSVKGFNEIYDIKPPIEKGLGAAFFNTNYFDPEVVNATQTADLFPPSNGLYPTAFYPGGNYYELGCLDEGDDYVARIRILFRAWDKVSEFTDKANPYTSDGSSEGADWGDLWHDRSIWNDLPAGYPAE